MNGSRENNQPDFDLDRFIDMFDQAMVSTDPRVVDALRSLMMMVILTKPEVASGPVINRKQTPLRGIYDDLETLKRRMSQVEAIFSSQLTSKYNYTSQNPWDEFDRYPNEKYSMKLDQQVLDNLKIQSQPMKKSGL